MTVTLFLLAALFFARYGWVNHVAMCELQATLAQLHAVPLDSPTFNADLDAINARMENIDGVPDWKRALDLRLWTAAQMFGAP